jgi:hypothetical protein
MQAKGGYPDYGLNKLLSLVAQFRRRPPASFVTRAAATSIVIQERERIVPARIDGYGDRRRKQLDQDQARRSSAASSPPAHTAHIPIAANPNT